MASSDAPLGRVFKHSTIYAFGNMLNRGAALLLLPIYTNYFTVGEYGVLELFYVVAAVVSGLLSVGIAHATLRFYFEYETEPERNAVVTTNLTVSFLITTAGVLLVGVWHEALARHVFGSPEYSRGVLLVLATLVFELSSQVNLAYLRAKEYSRLFVGIMFIRLVIQCTANTYFVVFREMDVQGVLLGNLLAVAFSWAVLTGFVLRECGYQFEWSKAVPALKYSFPFLLSTATGLMSAYADRFLVNAFLNLQLLGVYALALKFSELLDSLIGEPFSRSYGAFRFSVMKDSDAAESQARIVRYLLIALTVVGLGIVYFANDLLVMMTAPAYWPAASIVPVLMVGALLKVLAYPLQTGILYAKKTHHIFHLGVLAAVTSITANFVSIRWLGLFGACLAQVVTASVVVFATNRISQRYFRVRYEYRRIAVIIGVAVCFYLSGFPFMGMPMVIGIPMKLLLFLTFIMAMIFSGALDRSEIASLRSVLKRMISRQRQ